MVGVCFLLLQLHRYRLHKRACQGTLMNREAESAGVCTRSCMIRGLCFVSCRESASAICYADCKWATVVAGGYEAVRMTPSVGTSFYKTVWVRKRNQSPPVVQQETV